MSLMGNANGRLDPTDGWNNIILYRRIYPIAPGWHIDYDENDLLSWTGRNKNVSNCINGFKIYEKHKA